MYDLWIGVRGLALGVLEVGRGDSDGKFWCESGADVNSHY
jgi:hypothetical protein